MNVSLTKNGSDAGHIKEAEPVNISINLAMVLLKLPDTYGIKGVYCRMMAHYIHVPPGRAYYPVLALVIPLFFPSQRQMGMGVTLYKI